MGPGSTIDPQPGGPLIAADPESGQPKTGRVLEVVPERRLHWVWRRLGDDSVGRATEVIIELEPTEYVDHDDGPTPPGTVITVIERPTPLTVSGPASPSALALAR